MIQCTPTSLITVGNMVIVVAAIMLAWPWLRSEIFKQKNICTFSAQFRWWWIRALVGSLSAGLIQSQRICVCSTTIQWCKQMIKTQCCSPKKRVKLTGRATTLAAGVSLRRGGRGAVWGANGGAEPGRRQAYASGGTCLCIAACVWLSVCWWAPKHT